MPHFQQEDISSGMQALAEALRALQLPGVHILVRIAASVDGKHMILQQHLHAAQTSTPCLAGSGHWRAVRMGMLMGFAS